MTLVLQRGERMIPIDKNKIRTAIEVVEEYSLSREFEEVTLQEVNFYYNAFWGLVTIIEEITGEKFR